MSGKKNKGEARLIDFTKEHTRTLADYEDLIFKYMTVFINKPKLMNKIARHIMNTVDPENWRKNLSRNDVRIYTKAFRVIPAVDVYKKKSDYIAIFESNKATFEPEDVVYCNLHKAKLCALWKIGKIFDENGDRYFGSDYLKEVDQMNFESIRNGLFK